MKRLVNLYRRLDLLQRRRWFHIAATCLVLLVCGVVFGNLLNASYSLDHQREALATVLFDIDANRGAAAGFKETGTIHAGSRTYGGKEWIKRADLFIEPSSGLITAPVQLIEALLADQKPAWAPPFLLEQPQTTWLLAGVTALWLLLIIWINISLPYVLTVLGTALAVSFPWWLGSERWVVALQGIGLLGFTYVLLSRVVLLLFSFPKQALAVAHTVVKEASRLKISVVFILALLVVLPLMPMVLNPERPLRFRIQTFISWSLLLTFGAAALMTLFLSCATVAFEIRDRQIWQLVTKPLARLNYLLGKWMGVMGVNTILLMVSGVSIFMYVQYLRMQPVGPGLDPQTEHLAVEGEILTARIGALPVYDMLSPDQVRQRVEQLIANDPLLAEQEAKEQLTPADRRRLAGDVQAENLRNQRAIGPAKNPLDGRTYTFKGLGSSLSLTSNLTLRFRFLIGRSDEHESYHAGFVFNEDPRFRVRVEYVPTVTKTITIPPDLVRPDGSISVTVVNLPEPGKRADTLHFEEKDFELLYKAGDFEGNFVRAMLVLWTRLAFLAMLAVACSTFLSFPVAWLLSATVFLAGILGPYLSYSLEEYYASPASQIDFGDIGMVIGWAFQNVIRFLAQCILFVFGSYGTLNPRQSLVEGRLISWLDVGQVVLWVGVVWTGMTLLVGHLVFRKRELAIYSGQG